MNTINVHGVSLSLYDALPCQEESEGDYRWKVLELPELRLTLFPAKTVVEASVGALDAVSA